jgi:hypothetical protein
MALDHLGAKRRSARYGANADNIRRERRMAAGAIDRQAIITIISPASHPSGVAPAGRPAGRPLPERPRT